MLKLGKDRGISTFIAVLLLMVLAVSAGVVIYAYTMGYLGGLGTRQTPGAMSLDTASGTTSQITAWIRNIGSKDLTLDRVYVGGDLVKNWGNASGTIAQGATKKIVISGSYSSGVTYEVKVMAKDNTQLTFSVKID
ncbi:MAG: hypothetical protein DRI26_00800 [Chloroflexi bacterium]|nr:MAG: hypothetical protein DRI26_00800 [Chloroflexota bacterium]